MESEPNETELSILKHLWKAGAQSAREVHLAIGTDLGWQPSTTRTVIARMVSKELLIKRDVHGLAVFEAKADKVRTLAALIRGVTHRLLETNSALPASFFSSSPMLSEAEAAELAKLIESAEDDDVG